jgi:dienelactone hydrolase
LRTDDRPACSYLLLPAPMPIQTENIIHHHDGAELHGLLVWDDALPSPRQTVIIAHAWAGRGENELRRAHRLVELGYAAFAIDLYGGGKLGTSKEENAAMMQPFLDDRHLLRSRMLSILDTVRHLEHVDPQRITAIGYCFGGLCVLDLARSGAELDGVVSFHGLLIPLDIPPHPIRARVLVLHGADDPMVPREQVIALQDELTGAGAEWQIHLYGNTVHAFTNPAANDPEFGTVYNEKADRHSWQSLLDFLTA